MMFYYVFVYVSVYLWCFFDPTLCCLLMLFVFFFSSRRRHTRCALVTGVQTCALPIFGQAKELLAELGVNVETEADGRPSLSVNLHHIIGKLSDMTGDRKSVV